jgi:hypothetical protein
MTFLGLGGNACHLGAKNGWQSEGTEDHHHAGSCDNYM